jgi:hypothetical protein
MTAILLPWLNFALYVALIVLAGPSQSTAAAGD